MSVAGWTRGSVTLSFEHAQEVWTALNWALNHGDYRAGPREGAEEFHRMLRAALGEARQNKTGVELTVGPTHREETADA